MTNTIMINDALRVRDFDSQQYTVDYKSGINKETGEDYWSVFRYCGTPKSVNVAVRTYLGTEAANNARREAEFAWDGCMDSYDVLNLPEKGKKK